MGPLRPKAAQCVVAFLHGRSTLNRALSNPRTARWVSGIGPWGEKNVFEFPLLSSDDAVTSFRSHFSMAGLAPLAIGRLSRHRRPDIRGVCIHQERSDIGNAAFTLAVGAIVFGVLHRPADLAQVPWADQPTLLGRPAIVSRPCNFHFRLFTDPTLLRCSAPTATPDLIGPHGSRLASTASGSVRPRSAPAPSSP